MIRFLLIFLFLMSSVHAQELIKDELVEATLDKNLKIPPKIELKLKDLEVPVNSTKPVIIKPVYKDNLVDTTLKGKTYKIPEPNLNYDYSDDKAAVVRIRPVKTITSNRNSAIGDTVTFVVVEDVIYEGKVILKKNSNINAIIENISPNARFGVPASIVISRFTSPLVEKRTLDGEFNRHGKNNSLWVYPLSYVLSPFGGYGLTFIRGGNAKIKANEILEIYYRPTRFKKH